MRSRSLLLSGALLVMATPSLAIEYNGANLRDPFQEVEGRASAGKAATAQAQASDPATPALQGVLWNSKDPHAIINGQIVQVGSRVGQSEVIRIDKEGVTLSRNGREELLSRKGGRPS